MRLQSPILLSAAALAFGLLPLVGCAGTQSQVPPPEAVVVAPEPAPVIDAKEQSPLPSGPRLVAAGDGVTVAAPNVEARTLADAETVDLDAGAMVAVDAASRAAFSWSDAQAAELLAGNLLGGASLTVQSVDPVAGTLSLLQEAGTARFTLGNAATVKVTAGQLLVSAAEPTSSFVLSLAAKAGAPVWVAVDKGAVSLGKPAPVASASSASGAAEAVTLKAGQAAAFDTAGKLLGQVDLPAEKLGAWFKDAEAGTATGPMATLPAAKAAAQPLAVSQPAVAPVAPVAASFGADAMVVDAGACTTLRWNAADAFFATLDGNDVPVTGSQQVCLTEPRNYRFSWVGKDGKEQASVLGISVRSAATDGNEDDEEDVEAPPVPTPEPTECVGPECEIPGPTGAEEPGVGAEPGPAEPAPAEPAPAEPAPAEPAPAEPGPPEPQPTP